MVSLVYFSSYNIGVCVWYGMCVQWFLCLAVLFSSFIVLARSLSLSFWIYYFLWLKAIILAIIIKEGFRVIERIMPQGIENKKKNE